MQPFDFQLIQWKCIPQHRHPLLSAYEARRLIREPSCLLLLFVLFLFLFLFFGNKQTWTWKNNCSPSNKMFRLLILPGKKMTEGIATQSKTRCACLGYHLLRFDDFVVWVVHQGNLVVNKIARPGGTHMSVVLVNFLTALYQMIPFFWLFSARPHVGRACVVFKHIFGRHVGLRPRLKYLRCTERVFFFFSFLFFFFFFFFWLETIVLGTNFFAKMCVLGAEIESKSEKIWLEKANFFFKKCKWGLDLELMKSLKWWVSGTKKQVCWKRGSWGQHMPVLPFNVNAPGLEHFICWGVVSSTSYFLFVRVGTNRLMGRLAATNRDMHRRVTLYRSQ